MPAPKGNNYAAKWPTPKERQAACKAFCDHISHGFSIESFPDASRKTIRYYAEQYPEDFPPEKLEEAARRGLLFWEKLGQQGAQGKIDGFNSASWIFNMKNRAGWRDRTDIDARGIFGTPDDAQKMEKLKPRSTEQIALGVMAILTGEKAGDDGNGSGSSD
ncbi:hypothetical protein [Roseibium sediminis]|uniref:hypothetical protein n=1 Tax=Roseibium sediminis TaxID=1775174 RepID=UPI00123DD935|nr:hypothetical protein [Roseibium sediminis]